jgi:hypothetical protein
MSHSSFFFHEAEEAEAEADIPMSGCVSKQTQTMVWPLSLLCQKKFKNINDIIQYNILK